MTKKAIFILILLFTALLCTPVYAEVDIDYSGPIDSFTGLPKNSNTDTTLSNGIVYVTRDVSYDFAKGIYMIYLESNTSIDSSARYVGSNIVSGMITTQPVSFSGDSLGLAQLYRNGELLQLNNLDNITEAGEYVLQVKSGANSDDMLINFTIVPASTSIINGYSMPEGFSVTNVKRDGEEVAWSSTYAEMEAEGNYEIVYRCNANKKEYNLQVQIDKTPPTLALAAVKDGKANGPVMLDDVEPGANVHVTFEGKTIKFTKELTLSGTYMITITDAAQNSSKYQFTILVYFNDNSYILIALILGGIAALVAYIKITKKRMRIC